MTSLQIENLCAGSVSVLYLVFVFIATYVTGYWSQNTKNILYIVAVTIDVLMLLIIFTLICYSPTITATLGNFICGFLIWVVMNFVALIVFLAELTY